MTDPIIKGMGFGLVLSVAMGPVFFELMRLSMLLPYRKAVFFALGIMMSDLALGLAMLLTLGSWHSSFEVSEWGRWLGGMLFIGLGAGKLWHHRHMPVSAYTNTSFSYAVDVWTLFLKGVSLNVFNPFVMAFWVAIASLARSQYSADVGKGIIFIVSIVMTVFGFDNVKMWVGGRLRGRMNMRWSVWISRITGLIFMAAGIRILLM